MALPGAQALQRAGLQPASLSYKEGLALNNGTAQMLATGVLNCALYALVRFYILSAKCLGPQFAKRK